MQTDGPPPNRSRIIFKTMGKKTNTTSKNSGTAPKAQSVTDGAKRPAGKGLDKKKSSLTEKAAKVVAAVAAGVGGAIAAKRSVSTRRKTPPLVPTAPATIELPTASPGYSHEEIATRAYFIAEKRRTSGQPADPRQDWLDAERELALENGATHR